jgi:hypothetical protein
MQAPNLTFGVKYPSHLRSQHDCRVKNDSDYICVGFELLCVIAPSELVCRLTASMRAVIRSLSKSTGKLVWKEYPNLLHALHSSDTRAKHGWLDARISHGVGFMPLTITAASVSRQSAIDSL